jgi:predicted acylesterase/phospholipase RssA
MTCVYIEGNDTINSDTDTIILSGGSTTGIVMLGKLTKLILFNGLDIKNIKTFGGTSIGAVICLLLAVGYEPPDIAHYLYTNEFWGAFSDIDPYRILEGRGLFTLSILIDELSKMILLKLPFLPKFSDLTCNYLCSSFNLCQNKMVYFDNVTTPDMDVVSATVMSCAIPLLFEPCIFEGHRYIDGGIIDNFPIKKTASLFNSKHILGMKCFKDRSSEDNTVWNFGDLLAILFASSECHVSEQLETLPDVKVQMVRVKSTVPFYNLTLDKEKICKMFVSGFF